MEKRGMKFLYIGILIVALVVLFILASKVPENSLSSAGKKLPLPVFTFLIALIDGFNPCNIFVLTLLLGFMVSVSHSRSRIYLVGYTFILVVFLIYFLFMAAWLNIFKYIGFTNPLRYAIGALAIVAGLINVKEMFYFRKGITLMIQEKHKKPLVRMVERFRILIKEGTIPTLIISAVALAAFSSLLELPCTAGFPIIYTGILSSKVLAGGFSYYFYLLFYNLIYILPLVIIIGIFGWTFKGKTIKKEQMQLIKFIGGLIMILLGLILFFKPGLITAV